MAQSMNWAARRRSAEVAGVTRTQELGADLGYGLQGTALNE